MRVPCSQENFSGKDLEEQSGENWVTATAQIGHEGDEQPVGGQVFYRTSNFQRTPAAECPKGANWLKGKVVKQPGEC